MRICRVTSGLAREAANSASGSNELPLCVSAEVIAVVTAAANGSSGVGKDDDSNPGVGGIEVAAAAVVGASIWVTCTLVRFAAGSTSPVVGAGLGSSTLCVCGSAGPTVVLWPCCLRTRLASSSFFRESASLSRP